MHTLANSSALKFLNTCNEFPDFYPVWRALPFIQIHIDAMCT